MHRRVNLVVGAAIGLAALPGCGFDNDQPAPPVAAPPGPGPCQGTEALIPRLLAFVEGDGLTPVRTVVERRFLPTEANPQPEPSIRSLAAALLRIVSSLGLEKTGFLAEVAASEEVEQGLGPLTASFLGFIDGRADGRDHYDATEAAGWFVQRCDPDFLLTGTEQLLRLQSPSEGQPWVVSVIEALLDLADDPALEPFLISFESTDGRGRDAVVALLAQFMTIAADPAFDPIRIDTLLESLVYPLVDGPLETKIRRLTRLLDEAVDPAAGVLEPLQGSLRCGLAHPPQRDVLLGTIHDLLLAPPEGTTAGLNLLREPIVAEQLGLLADVVAAVRDDLDGRVELRQAAVILLSRPDVEVLVPGFIDLLDAGVLAEIVEAFARLLVFCAED